MLQYFGTQLDNTGHYFWQLGVASMHRSRMNLGNCPFNPEALPHKAQKNGDTQFYQFAGYSIYAIEGSCKDTRPQSKSVFFIEQEITQEELKHLILTSPIGKKIIDKMTFTVTW